MNSDEQAMLGGRLSTHQKEEAFQAGDHAAPRQMTRNADSRTYFGDPFLGGGSRSGLSTINGLVQS